jgi:hypothetical protein
LTTTPALGWDRAVDRYELRRAELLRRPLYGTCYDRTDADW